MAQSALFLVLSVSLGTDSPVLTIDQPTANQTFVQGQQINVSVRSQNPIGQLAINIVDVSGTQTIPNVAAQTTDGLNWTAVLPTLTDGTYDLTAQAGTQTSSPLRIVIGNAVQINTIVSTPSANETITATLQFRATNVAVDSVQFVLSDAVEIKYR